MATQGTAREELEGGITPGDGFGVRNRFRPRRHDDLLRRVFPGRLALLHRADRSAADLGRPGTAIRGAGAWNNVFPAVSSYGHPTCILNPNGNVIARPDDGTVAYATIDLNRSHRRMAGRHAHAASPRNSRRYSLPRRGCFR